MQNTFSQSGNDSKRFLIKIICQNRYVALETPSRPSPPLHGKCHLKFPFWLLAPFPYPQIILSEDIFATKQMDMSRFNIPSLLAISVSWQSLLVQNWAIHLSLVDRCSCWQTNYECDKKRQDKKILKFTHHLTWLVQHWI